MNSGSERAIHPNLERYYDRHTDRAAVDRHLAGCGECQAWLDDIHERLGHLRCVEFVELVTAYLEDAVEAAMRDRIDDHLRLCEGCRNYRDQVQATIATIGRVGEEDEPVDLPEDVRAGLVAAFHLWRRQAIEERRPADG
jgi:predicted anti-sigma-YlaC factor YlaD